MRIFLSVASPDRAQAEEVSLALRGEGHIVFLDDHELPPGESYHLRIRKAIESADLMVFFVSPHSIHPKRYTLAELKFAQDKWPNPTGRVLPVLVASTEMNAIPAYLRAVSIYSVRGNIAAEVAYEVNRMGRALPRRQRPGRADARPSDRRTSPALSGAMFRDLGMTLLLFLPLGAAVGMLNADLIGAFYRGSQSLAEAFFCGAAFAALTTFALYYFNFRSPRELLTGATASLVAYLLAGIIAQQLSGRMGVLEWALLGAVRAGVLSLGLSVVIPTFKNPQTLGALILSGGLASGIAEALPDSFGYTVDIEPVLWATFVAGTLCAGLSLLTSLGEADDDAAVAGGRNEGR